MLGTTRIVPFYTIAPSRILHHEDGSESINHPETEWYVIRFLRGQGHEPAIPGSEPLKFKTLKEATRAVLNLMESY